MFPLLVPIMPEMPQVPLGGVLSENQVYSNASYLELFRLTGERFTDYYDLVSQQSMSHSVSQIGPNFQVLLRHNPHYLFDIGTAVTGALCLTFLRALLCNLLISVSEPSMITHFLHSRL